jgi:cytoskeletal protein CcmA (bactofilin family)
MISLLMGESKAKSAAMAPSQLPKMLISKPKSQPNRSVIYGKVHGNVTCTERVEIKGSAEMVGDVKASTISIEPGAIFVGKSEVGNPSSAPKKSAPISQSGDKKNRDHQSNKPQDNKSQGNKPQDNKARDKAS